MARKRLGEMLIEAGLITEAQLKNALFEQRRWGRSLGRILVGMQIVSEDALVNVLGQQLGVEIVNLDAMDIPQPILDLVPAHIAQQAGLVPFAQQLKFLDVAMADPTNAGVIDELRIRTQLNIRPFLAGPRMIERAVVKFYRGGRDVEIPIDVDDVGVSGRLPVMDGSGAALPKPQTQKDNREAEIDALQRRISKLEALVERDEQVLRKLLAMLIDKGFATREEVLERLK